MEFVNIVSVIYHQGKKQLITLCQNVKVGRKNGQMLCSVATSAIKRKAQKVWSNLGLSC